MRKYQYVGESSKEYQPPLPALNFVPRLLRDMKHADALKSHTRSVTVLLNEQETQPRLIADALARVSADDNKLPLTRQSVMAADSKVRPVEPHGLHVATVAV